MIFCESVGGCGGGNRKKIVNKVFFARRIVGGQYCPKYFLKKRKKEAEKPR